MAANQQDKPTPIIMGHEPEGTDDIPDAYYDDAAVSGNGCGCFNLLCCLGSRRQEGETAGFLHHQSGDLLDKDNWMMRRVKSMKEFSEVVAGPKWKNFIRKFSKKPRWRKITGNKAAFQYDPQSYALNFNDYEEDEDLLPRSFSTRFAPPPPRA